MGTSIIHWAVARRASWVWTKGLRRFGFWISLPMGSRIERLQQRTLVSLRD